MIHFTKIVAGILVALALALGGYAAWLSRQAPAAAAPQAELRPRVVEPTYPVVVTRRAVPAGMPLAADALRVAQLPVDPPDALHDLASATGRIPMTALGEGTPLMESQMASGLALRLGEGERAVAVKADEVMGVGNRVRPGDFVDVFLLLRTDNREIERTQARLLLSRLRVLAFGTSSVDGDPPSADGVPSQPARNGATRLEAARTAVLAVPVEDVARLALGDGNGHLLLALRHPNDDARPDAHLFASLPGALRPASARAGAQALAPIDQAQAGIAMTDLARGGAASPANAPAAMAAVPPVLPTVAPTSQRASTGRAPRGGTEVELILGNKRETLTY